MVLGVLRFEWRRDATSGKKLSTHQLTLAARRVAFVVVRQSRKTR